MTAKQALLEAVVSLNEDDAVRILNQIRFEQADATRRLTPTEISLIREALAESGPAYSVDDIERELGLRD